MSGPIPPYQMVVPPRGTTIPNGGIPRDGDTTLLGSEHLNNLTHNEGKAVYLKNIEKRLVPPGGTTLLGSEHLNNFTYNEGKAVYLKNIEKKELGWPRHPNLIKSIQPRSIKSAKVLNSF